MTENKQAEVQRKLNYESFAPKFGNWAFKFKPFIEGKEMWDIYQKIKKDRQYEIICPEHKNTFRAFSITEPWDVKVIFYLQDPYPRKYKDGSLQATGIAMDCTNSKTGYLQPSLEKWYETIDKELDIKVKRSPDLSYLLQQGIMLLNSEFTCKLNKTESHEGLWAPFQKFFLEEVMYGTTGIIYVLCGKSSHKLERYINPLGNYIFKIEHPSYAAKTGADWETGGIFTTINRLLKENNNEKIFWNKKDWEEYIDPPF